MEKYLFTKMSKRKDNFDNIGVQGRRTGITLDDSVTKDEHGFPDLDELFAFEEEHQTDINEGQIKINLRNDEGKGNLKSVKLSSQIHPKGITLANRATNNNHKEVKEDVQSSSDSKTRNNIKSIRGLYPNKSAILIEENKGKIMDSSNKQILTKSRSNEIVKGNEGLSPYKEIDNNISDKVSKNNMTNETVRKNHTFSPIKNASSAASEIQKSSEYLQNKEPALGKLNTLRTRSQGKVKNLPYLYSPMRTKNLTRVSKELGHENKIISTANNNKEELDLNISSENQTNNTTVPDRLVKKDMSKVNKLRSKEYNMEVPDATPFITVEESNNNNIPEQLNTNNNNLDLISSNKSKILTPILKTTSSNISPNKSREFEKKRVSFKNKVDFMDNVEESRSLKEGSETNKSMEREEESVNQAKIAKVAPVVVINKNPSKNNSTKIQDNQLENSEQIKPNNSTKKSPRKGVSPRKKRKKLFGLKRGAKKTLLPSLLTESDGELVDTKSKATITKIKVQQRSDIPKRLFRMKMGPKKNNKPQIDHSFFFSTDDEELEPISNNNDIAKDIVNVSNNKGNSTKNNKNKENNIKPVKESNPGKEEKSFGIPNRRSKITHENQPTNNEENLLLEKERSRGLEGRHSKRQRITPRKFWENEGIDIHSPTTSITQVFHTKKQSATNNEKLNGDDLNIFEEFDINATKATQKGKVSTIVNGKCKVKEMDLVFEAIKPTYVNPNYSVTILNQYKSFYQVGLLTIDGLKEKPIRVNSKFDLKYQVLQGKVQVSIDDSNYIVNNQQFFTVPPNVKYSILNLNAKKTKLLYFLSKENS